MKRDVISRANLMTNEAIDLAPSKAFPIKGAEYWLTRTEAIKQAKNNDWQKAIPLLEKLTQAYRDDGDTWFLLGYGYLQTEDYNNAIVAFKHTLKFGTILAGVDSASPPANDIMVNIAQCYSVLGDQEQALFWIKQALIFRWDDRPSLINNPHFKNIAELDAFKKLSGEFRESDLSRNESWISDLKFLVNEMKRLHVDLYHTISAKELELKVNSIETDIAKLTDQQIVFRFMELVASVGNGHNFIVPAYSLKGSFSQLPVQFYWFSDGIYVVKAKSEYKQLVGRKVISVAKKPVEQVMNKIASLNARDNEMQQYWLGPYYLSLPEVLEGLNIVKSAKNISFTLMDREGNQGQITWSGEPLNFTGFPTLPKLELLENPTYLKNVTENYWYQYNKEDDYLYIQFNAVEQKESQSLAEFSKEVRRKITQEETGNVVLDLRHNSGGDGSIIPPLTRALLHFIEQNENNKLFVIVGRNTFSAAHLFLTDLNRLTDAIIVGEPSGSRPNHLGEAGWFRLPHTEVRGVISSQYHQASHAEDHRVWIAPHLPVTLSSAAYFSGEDPAMKQIIDAIKQQ